MKIVNTLWNGPDQFINPIHSLAVETEEGVAVPRRAPTDSFNPANYEALDRHVDRKQKIVVET